MLRESHNAALRWADKTCSLLQERQLEVCEDILSTWPETGVFDPNPDELRLPLLWQLSYAAQEQPLDMPLYSAETLRRDVTEGFREEVLLLTAGEVTMMQGLADGFGSAELTDMEDTVVAETLMRRLWCRPEWLDDERVLLRLPHELCTAFLAASTAPDFAAVQEALFTAALGIHSLLALNGALYADSVLNALVQLTAGKPGVPADEQRLRRLLMRWLKAGFDYTWNRSRRMLLLHPGLADPEKACPPDLALNAESLSRDRVTSILAGVLPEEMPLMERLSALLTDVIRPELQPPVCAQDLMILAKQGVPPAEMNEALSSMLAYLPTPALTAAVRQLNTQLLRWPGFVSAVVH